MRRLEGRVATVTSSLQDLSVSVTVGFVEQREYTEFAFQRLETRIDRLETRIERLETRIDGLEARIDALDRKIDDVENRLSAKIDSVIGRLERLERLERKLDQFIDVQTEANRLTDLRLRSLER